MCVETNKRYLFIYLSVTRFFVIRLFHELKPSGPLKNRLKWFCLKIPFRGDIRETFDSVQTNTARSQTPRKLTLRGVDN